MPCNLQTSVGHNSFSTINSLQVWRVSPFYHQLNENTYTRNAPTHTHTHLHIKHCVSTAQCRPILILFHGRKRHCILQTAAEDLVHFSKQTILPLHHAFSLKKRPFFPHMLGKLIPIWCIVLYKMLRRGLSVISRESAIWLKMCQFCKQACSGCTYKTAPLTLTPFWSRQTSCGR